MKEALPAIAAHARATYPAECCGLVLREASGVFRFQPIANVAGSDAGQKTSSRGQRDGYVMDSKQLLAALETVEAAGGSLYAIVHSHPDVGAYFSKEDKDMALGGETEPLWPGVRYLVVSVRKGAVDAARLYTWNAAARDFAEEEVSEIAVE
ncbi:MAG TPA: M67 family metallopeptidase [Myxococcales bacterium]|jgi:adenylyltransferase/sulfurtransferase